MTFSSRSCWAEGQRSGNKAQSDDLDGHWVIDRGTEGWRGHLEAADEGGRNGAVELRQHLVAGGDDSVQALSGGATHLPAHVVVIAVLIVTAWWHQ